MPEAERSPEAGRHDGVEASVVICTHSFERRRMLADLIGSLGAGSLVPYEVVIVVDRNQPLLDELLEERWPIDVRLLPSSGSGLAAARNTGWQATVKPLVAFIDDDAVASSGWLRELVEAARHTGAGIVGGSIEPRWPFEEPRWYSPMLGWIVGCSYEGQPTAPARVRNVIGCNMLVRRDLLEQLGGFDESLGRMGAGLAGCEETELCIRANRSGAEVLLIEGAMVAQVLSAERSRLSYALRRGWHEGRSKRMLVDLHGPVLGTERRYARRLLRHAGERLAAAIRERQRSDGIRAFALVAVFGATTISYFAHAYSAHGVPSPVPRAT